MGAWVGIILSGLVYLYLSKALKDAQKELLKTENFKLYISKYEFDEEVMEATAEVLKKHALFLLFPVTTKQLSAFLTIFSLGMFIGTGIAIFKKMFLEALLYGISAFILLHTGMKIFPAGRFRGEPKDAMEGYERTVLDDFINFIKRADK